ncbi:MAG: anti-sigma F factor [Symbiobacterium sp.]|uniref:anti-sigma F factor n=1 Tax=Symbiobacterium sp. TaxID=1971213 RepID=UPI00346446B0
MVARNRVIVELAAIPENVGVARLMAAMVAAQGEFTVAEVDEVKLAVSEAVTNAIVHGYRGDAGQMVRLEATLSDGVLEIVVADRGRGIEDVELARQAAVTSDPERMGLGFCFMEAHMDEVRVESEVGRGTRVTMTKRPAAKSAASVKGG